ncbi:hypothetical protein [Rhizobium sp. BK251]|uniref:hypothetical protein n=1 Tax=Rhizobium sp. BK251 TaxID=2512125 RepID=UPI00104EE1A8|nr:hypothetical protein [Rhizobium sp. BK251]TCL74920.1 hypothetical protein EV286_102484 [Rhizobium sp. BK251]
MPIRISKVVLTSAAALALTVALPALQPTGSSILSSAAFARGGSDDGGGNSGRGGGDNSRSDDHGGDSRGDDGGRSSDDGRTDSYDRGGDDNGGHRHGSDRRDDARDDRDDRRPRNDDRAERPRTTLDVSQDRLDGLLNGSLVATDQLGRRLEIEVEFEHGTRTVEAKVHRSDAIRNPGPIGSITITPASAR